MLPTLTTTLIFDLPNLVIRHVRAWVGTYCFARTTFICLLDSCLSHLLLPTTWNLYQPDRRLTDLNLVIYFFIGRACLGGQNIDCYFRSRKDEFSLVRRPIATNNQPPFWTYWLNLQHLVIISRAWVRTLNIPMNLSGKKEGFISVAQKPPVLVGWDHAWKQQPSFNDSLLIIYYTLGSVGTLNIWTFEAYFINVCARPAANNNLSSVLTNLYGSMTCLSMGAFT